MAAPSAVATAAVTAIHRGPRGSDVSKRSGPAVASSATEARRPVVRTRRMISSVSPRPGPCSIVIVARIRLNDSSPIPFTPARHSRSSAISSGQSMPSTWNVVFCLFPFCFMAYFLPGWAAYISRSCPSRCSSQRPMPALLRCHTLALAPAPRRHAVGRRHDKVTEVQTA